MDARMMDGFLSGMVMLAIIIAVVALGIGVLIVWWIA